MGVASAEAAANLKLQHGEAFFQTLRGVTPAAVGPGDPANAFRALLYCIRLSVGVAGFLAFGFLILGLRRGAIASASAAAALACAAAILYAGPFVIANVFMCALAVSVALIVALWSGAGDRWLRVTVGAAALAGGLALSNLLVFHDWRIADGEAWSDQRWGPVNFHDQFHYFLGAKYFEEVSYADLYACAARVAMERGEPVADKPARDLRTNAFVTTAEIVRRSDICRRRFTSARWKAFSEDVAFFRDSVSDRARVRYTADHGYNATPLLTAIHHPVVARLAAGWATLGALAMIDALLFAGSIVLIAWSFGPVAASLAALAWGVSVLWVYDHVGLPGSIGRYWWVAAMIAAICAARRQLLVMCGLFLSAATFLRAFPGLFFIVPAVLAAAGLASTQCLPKAVGRIFIGAALGSVLFAIVSILGVGGSLSGYEAFLTNSSKHEMTRLSNFVGLPRLVSWALRALGFGSPTLASPGSPAVLVPALVLIAGAAWATRRLEPAAMLLFGGLTAMFRTGVGHQLRLRGLDPGRAALADAQRRTSTRRSGQLCRGCPGRQRRVPRNPGKRSPHLRARLAHHP